MQLAYTDGRAISDLSEVQTKRPIGHSPVEFSAQISSEGAAQLRAEPSSFYRASDGEQRYTLTIDTVSPPTVAGTIRRR